MKKGFQKTIFSVIGFAIVIILTAGCGEQQVSNNKSSTQKSRLVAAENIGLKKQLAQKDKEIERLKKAVEKCEAEKAEVKRDMEKDMESIGEEVMKTFSDYIELQQENEELKKQIEELKK